MENRKAIMPQVRIQWTSAKGIFVACSALGLVLFAAWSLWNAHDLKSSRRMLTERMQWYREAGTGLEILETPPLRKLNEKTPASLQTLLVGLENLRLSVSFAHHPSPNVLARTDLAIDLLRNGVDQEASALERFRTKMRTHIRRIQLLVKQEVMDGALNFSEQAQRVNQGLSASVVLVGLCLLLLVLAVQGTEETEMLKGAYEGMEEELHHLQRSQSQHYQNTFGSITNNLPYGVLVYRRNDILFANVQLVQWIRPGVKRWEDVEPELVVLKERFQSKRSELVAHGDDVDIVQVMARRFDGSAIEVQVGSDMPTVYREGDVQMVFIQPVHPFSVAEAQRA